MSRLPSKIDLLDWIRDNPDRSGKREIARAFGLKGADRIGLKALMRELEDDGHLSRRNRRVRPRGHLPSVGVVVIDGPDADGDLIARPKDWDSGDGTAPAIVVVSGRKTEALGAGDRVLAKLRPLHTEDGALAYEARPIKKIGAGPPLVLGIYRSGSEGGRIVPVDKKANKEWIVPHGDTGGAEDGELVEVEPLGGPRFGLPRGRVAARLGDPGAARQVSLIAIHEHGIPHAFPDDVLAEAEAAGPVTLGRREDLRSLPLVTIDPADARDHDDAVAAMPDDDPANPGGWVLWVAIADVAWYVRPGTALDREARKRGNSTYFPDRVSPMLPERLSADLCSLVEGEDRPCLAVRMVLDADGRLVGHRFTRGLMRSPAALSYEEAQAVAIGEPEDSAADPSVSMAIKPLFAAWRAAMEARAKRQPLDLDLPERRIELDNDGRVTAVQFRERFDAHRVIEEFMILANVAAAETLEAKKSPLLYRLHEEPNAEKLDALRDTAESIGLALPKGQVLKTRQLNRLLDAAAGSEHAEMINLAVLRSQTQAYYGPDNLGHFGLALRSYAHFTSPIRRYADLIVHRALITALGLGEGGLSKEERAALAETAEHISRTERRSMEAERDTTDRYLAAYLAERRGAEFEGRITGVQRFGLFVRLDETGADGLIPISTIGREFFRHDSDAGTLTGADTGRVIAIGQRATVKLVEAEPITGGLLLELLSVEGKPGGGGRSRGRFGRGEAGQAKGRGKLGPGGVARAKAARGARRPGTRRG